MHASGCGTVGVVTEDEEGCYTAGNTLMAQAAVLFVMLRVRLVITHVICDMRYVVD